MTTNLFHALADALSTTDIEEKLSRVDALADDLKNQRLVRTSPYPAHRLTCGRPERPVLVMPKAVPQRSPATLEGRATLLHAIVHIEFTAINLALDHAVRFPDLPEEYTIDWVTVAAEEAAHFRLLRHRLKALSFDYGDFPAHNGLWLMAEKTADDALARMALVPRLLEARGLDATPPIQIKLRQAGDNETADCLDMILRDEIGHVGLGDKWFRYLCKERNLPPEATYQQLLKAYRAPWPQAPLNILARRSAGFSMEELATLDNAPARIRTPIPMN